LAARQFWFIICLAAKAPCRRRPVSSTLGIALNNVQAIANGRKSDHAGAHPSGVRSTATPTARTSCAPVRQLVTGAARDPSAPTEAAAVQSVGGSAATRQTAPDGTTAGGGGECQRLRPFQRGCACSLSRVGRCTGSTLCVFRHRPAMPNMSLNRSASGRPAWPCNRLGSSSAARPSRPAAVARLALR
jgi:hypothetical protein